MNATYCYISEAETQSRKWQKTMKKERLVFDNPDRELSTRNTKLHFPLIPKCASTINTLLPISIFFPSAINLWNPFCIRKGQTIPTSWKLLQRRKKKKPRPPPRIHGHERWRWRKQTTFYDDEEKGKNTRSYLFKKIYYNIPRNK